MPFLYHFENHRIVGEYRKVPLQLPGVQEMQCSFEIVKKEENFSVRMEKKLEKVNVQSNSSFMRSVQYPASPCSRR